MIIRELFETVNTVEKFFKDAQVQDEHYNPVATDFAKENAKHYQNGSGVILKYKDDSDKFTNKPTNEVIPSAGYVGLQSIRKLAGLPYDKKVLN